MRVLLRIRSDVDRFPGGDYVQLMKTRDALERLGVSTIVAPGIEAVEAPVDVVHLFNTTRIHETALQFEQARVRGLPVVVSPIWHSLAEMHRFYKRLYHVPVFPIVPYLAAKEAFYARRSGMPFHLPAIVRFAATQRRVLSRAQAILPNSESESRILERETGVRATKTFVVPFGCDPPEVAPLPWAERRDLICAGRIEPRKNQLGLVEAFKSLGRTGDRLLLYGSLNSSHPRYVAKFQAALVPGWVEYGGHLPQKELHAVFARAKAVILASFFETFGLVALEAAACGANVCVSDSSYTRGFFGDLVTYCDPFDLGSIRASVSAALGAPHVDYTDFLAGMSWDAAARKTLEAYRFATAEGSGG